jgi:hypothetical protein
MNNSKLRSFFKKPSAKKAGEILNLSINQLRIMAGFLMGHFHLERRLFKLGLVNSP